MHLTDADLGAALDPAGGGAPGAAARAHAAQCAECTAALESARSADADVGAWLRLLDRPVRAVDLAAIRARAAARPSSDLAAIDVADPEPRSARSASPAGVNVRRPPGAGRAGLHLVRGGHGSAIRRGGILFVLAAAAAAAAVPRSPVRRLVGEVLAGLRAPALAPAPAAPVSPSGPPSSVGAFGAPRGVAFAPASTAPVAVLFRSTQPAGVIRIKPAPGSSVSVLASGEGAAYTVGRDTIIVDNRGAAASGLSYEVGLPPAAQLPDVALRIAGRIVFSRAGTTVVAPVKPGADGSYVISFAADRGAH